MESWTIRRAQAADLERVMEVLGEGRAALGRLGIDQWQRGYPTSDVVESDMGKGNCWVVAEPETGRIMATCCIALEGEPLYDSIDGAWLTEGDSSRPSYATVHRVAVADEGARRGLARRMFAHAERLAREAGYASVRVDTHEGNVRMRTLLPSLGFAECGVVMLSDPAEPTPERIAYEKLVA